MGFGMGTGLFENAGRNQMVLDGLGIIILEMKLAKYWAILHDVCGGFQQVILGNSFLERMLQRFWTCGKPSFCRFQR